MDLGDDYGDIRHKHGHIHSKPRKHQDTIDTALKDWCLEIFEEDGEEKCRDLNQNFFETIITGSTITGQANNVNLSEIYEKVNEMSKINYKKNQQNSNDNNFEISIDGTQLVLKINDKIFKKEIIVNESKELIAIFSLKKDLLSKVIDNVEELIPQSSNEEESVVSEDFRETLRSSSIDKGILENELNEINSIVIPDVEFNQKDGIVRIDFVGYENESLNEYVKGIKDRIEKEGGYTFYTDEKPDDKILDILESGDSDEYKDKFNNFNREKKEKLRMFCFFFINFLPDSPGEFPQPFRLKQLGEESLSSSLKTFNQDVLVSFSFKNGQNNDYENLKNTFNDKLDNINRIAGLKDILNDSTHERTLLEDFDEPLNLPNSINIQPNIIIEKIIEKFKEPLDNFLVKYDELSPLITAYDNDTDNDEAKLDLIKFFIDKIEEDDVDFYTELENIYENINTHQFSNLGYIVSNEEPEDGNKIFINFNDVQNLSRVIDNVESLQEKKNNIVSFLQSVIDNIDNNGTTSGGTTTEAERTTQAESNSQISNQSNITIKIKLEKDKFMINKEEFEYKDKEDIGNLITELENELNKIDLKKILDNNNENMDTIRMKKEEIDRIKLLKSDNLTPKRRLQYLEKWDQDIFKELVGLIGYLIIGICFGIYCIYNFFVLQLK